MLFDLESRGRKNFVKALYLSLAILLGGGLVLFGVGTGIPGSGLVDVFSGDGTDTSVQISDAEKRAKRLTVQNPKNEQAWVDLVRARYQLAEYDDATGAFTEAGLEKLTEVVTAWDKYLALEPKKPDANAAQLMAQVFSEAGLNEPARATEALEIVTEAKPSAATFSQLAQYAFVAGQFRKGDLAADKAVELAPKSQRKLVRTQLDNTRDQVLQQQAQEAVQQGTATTPDG